MHVCMCVCVCVYMLLLRERGSFILWWQRYSHMWHASFNWDMTHSPATWLIVDASEQISTHEICFILLHAYRDSFTHDTIDLRGVWLSSVLIHTWHDLFPCDVTHYWRIRAHSMRHMIYTWLMCHTWRDPHTTRLIHMRYAWHNSFLRVTWLNHTCDMTHSYVTWLVHMRHHRL